MGCRISGRDLQPCRIGTAAKQERELKAAGDREESVGVDRLAEAAGDELENGLVPMGVVLVDQGSDKFGAVAETLKKKGVAEGGPQGVAAGFGGEHAFTRNKGLVGHELVIPGQKRFGRSVPKGKDGDPGGRLCRIVLPNHMQNDI